MERLTINRNFPEKKDNFRRLSSFSTFNETTEIFRTICLHHLNQALMRGLHQFTWRALAATSICTQTLTAFGNGLTNGRVILFPISSVGNVQYHRSKISHRKFRLNGKRPRFSLKFTF